MKMTPEQRKETCKACPSNVLGICTKCACFVILKVKLKQADCPAGKWEIENDNTV